MNVVWDEQFMSEYEEVKELHEDAVTRMHLPEWTLIKCPYCGEKLEKRSIRTIGIKFNTRNIGDLVVEFACEKCSRMDVLYYRDELSSIWDFCLLLQGKRKPEGKALLEHDMYKENYNNLLELWGGKEITKVSFSKPSEGA